MKNMAASASARRHGFRPGFRGNGGVGAYAGPASDHKERYAKTLIAAVGATDSQTGVLNHVQK